MKGMLEPFDLVCGATAGGSGASTSTTDGDRILIGRIYAVGVKFTGVAAPATTTVVLTGKSGGDGFPAVPILSIPAGNTARWFYPRVAVQDVVGANGLYAAAGQPVRDMPFVNNLIEAVVALADDGVIASIRIMLYLG